MSKDSSEEQIVKKLDKVADSLENTTSQLSSVVTQQQLDLLRERVAKSESEIKMLLDTFSTLSETQEKKHASADDRQKKAEEHLAELDRDHSALRALIYSSFVLSTIAVIVVVVFAIQV